MTKRTTDISMPLLEHLDELRHRFFWSTLFFVGGSAVGYVIRQPLQHLLLSPVNQPVFYTTPTGGFDFVLKICLFFGFLVTIPVLIYHLLCFIAPALSRSIRRSIALILIASLILMLIGIGFAYFISLPAALYFLNKFSSDEIKSLLSANEYLSFVMLYLGGFALVFQLPLLILFVNWVSTLKITTLWRLQSYIIVGSFIVAAILTPTPDPLNQTIMALPIILLYEISMVITWLVNRRSSILS
jgi:sec-independent protein translocase protein TatC